MIRSGQQDSIIVPDSYTSIQNRKVQNTIVIDADGCESRLGKGSPGCLLAWVGKGFSRPN